MRKQEVHIQLSKEQKEQAASKLKKYFMENFEVEIGMLQSEFFIDFISENIGSYYYNKGIEDSLSYMTDKLDDLYLLMRDQK